MASFSLSAKTSSDPPASKRMKEEPEEEEEEEDDYPLATQKVYYTFTLKGGRICDVRVRFDRFRMSVLEPIDISSLSDFNLIIQSKVEEDEGVDENRDLRSTVVVRGEDGFEQAYELQQQLYESTRLRLGHLVPDELRTASVYSRTRCNDEMNIDSGRGWEEDATLSLDIDLRDETREIEMRRICGTMEVEGRLISCSREVLALYSSDPTIFLPHPRLHLEDAAAAAVELRQLTWLLVDRQELDVSSFAELVEWARMLRGYGYRSMIGPLIIRRLHLRRAKMENTFDERPPTRPLVFDLHTQPAVDVLRLASCCGREAEQFMPWYLSYFRRVECLRKMYVDHTQLMTSTVTKWMLEAIFALDTKQMTHHRPEVVFTFEEGPVRVQLLTDQHHNQTTRLLQWMRERRPDVVKRRRVNAVSLAEAVPGPAVKDPVHSDGRVLHFTHKGFIHPNYSTDMAFYGEPMLFEVDVDIFHSTNAEDIREGRCNVMRFSRHCWRPIGVVVQGEQLVPRLTHLKEIRVVDCEYLNYG